MKKFLTIIIVLLIIFSLYKLLFTNSSNYGVPFESADLVLFWGNGCPHCEKVKDYIKENNLDKTVKISYKEVYYDKSNQKLLQDSVKKCPEIDSSQGIGVPMGLERPSGVCLYGDQPIIDWLKSKMLK
jgi:glutaredoxin